MTRTELHQLLDAVREGDLDAVRRAIEPFADPLRLTLATVDLDYEPTTDEEEPGRKKAVRSTCAAKHAPGTSFATSVAVTEAHR